MGNHPHRSRMYRFGFDSEVPAYRRSARSLRPMRSYWLRFDDDGYWLAVGHGQEAAAYRREATWTEVPRDELLERLANVWPTPGAVRLRLEWNGYEWWGTCTEFAGDVRRAGRTSRGHLYGVRRWDFGLAPEERLGERL